MRIGQHSFSLSFTLLLSLLSLQQVFAQSYAIDTSKTFDNTSNKSRQFGGIKRIKPGTGFGLERIQFDPAPAQNKFQNNNCFPNTARDFGSVPAATQPKFPGYKDESPRVIAKPPRQVTNENECPSVDQDKKPRVIAKPPLADDYPRVITKPPKQSSNPSNECPSADEDNRPRVIAKPPVAADYPRVIPKPPAQAYTPNTQCPSSTDDARPRVIAKPPVADDCPRVVPKPPQADNCQGANPQPPPPVTDAAGNGRWSCTQVCRCPNCGSELGVILLQPRTAVRSAATVSTRSVDQQQDF